MTIKITLPDGSSKEYESGVTASKIAENIGKGLAKAAIAAKINGELKDLGAPIESDAEVRILTFDYP